MGKADLEETYRFRVDDATFEWRRGDQTLMTVDEPSYALYSASAIEEDARGDAPSPVYLIVTGDGDEFVLETKVTAEEASEYAIRESDEEPDETLPVHLASSLLQRGRRSQ